MKLLTPEAHRVRTNYFGCSLGNFSLSLTIYICLLFFNFFFFLMEDSLRKKMVPLRSVLVRSMKIFEKPRSNPQSSLMSVNSHLWLRLAHQRLNFSAAIRSWK